MLAGKQTYHSGLGTLVHSSTKDWEAFIPPPEERIASAKSDMKSKDHGSGKKDPLSGELHLNRLRVTGLPYRQHNSRHVQLCEDKGQNCINPSHEVRDANQAVAEFEMSSVLRISGARGLFRLRIQTDDGSFEPDVLIALRDLHKSGL